MKAMVYVAALAVGGAVGAAGMGVYNVKVGGFTLEAPADSALLASEDSAAVAAEAGQENAAVEGTDGTIDSAGGEQIAATDSATASPPATQPTPVQVAQDDPPEVAPPDPDSIARAQLNYQRLARIFAAMKPDQAAPVLAQLDDQQLEGILMAMQGRNAAPILAAMDPERVASISRTVLRGNE